MKSNTLHLRRAILCFVFFFGMIGGDWGQNAIVGSGFSSGWGNCNSSSANYTNFVSGAGTTYTSGALTPNATGNQYWRLAKDWSGTYGQYNNGGTSDAAVVPNTIYNLNVNNCSISGAMFRNVASTSYRYVFKTLNAGTNPTGTWVFFEIQGDVRTISSLTQPSGTVVPGSSPTVSVTLNGALANGQDVWLRYTTDNFASSSCLKMTGSSTSYSTTIPAGTNTAGATITYYAFTSGNGTSISGTDADLYTINLMNNSGLNYSYTVASNFYSKSTGNIETLSNWGTSADGSGTAPVNFTTAGVTYNIRNNATPTIGASWTVSGTSSKIVVGDGTNACNFIVPSNYVVTSSNIEVSNAGKITRTSSAVNPFIVSGTFNILAGGTYVHNYANGTLPFIIWASTANLNIDENLANDEFTESFGNVNINGNSTVRMMTTTGNISNTIQGNLTINSTGVVVATETTTTNQTLTINGNLTVSSNSGSFYIESNTTSYNVTKKILVLGSYIQTSGILNIASNTSTLVDPNERISILEVRGDFTQTGGSITESATDSDYRCQILLSKTSGIQYIESIGNTTGLIEFNVAGSGAQCVVPATKTFVQSGVSPTFVVANGSQSIDLNILGTFKRTSANPITTTGTVQCGSGGTYEHAVDGGSVPSMTWNSTSTFLVSGITSSTAFTSGSIQSYGNVTWNCPSQSSAFSFGGLTTVNGNLTIQSTGASPNSTSCLLLTNSSTLASNIAGNLSITGGYFAPFGSSTSGNCSLAIGGDLSLATGTFDIFRQASNTSTINLSGNFSMTSGTLTKFGNGIGNFNFAKSGTQTYTKSGGTISNAVNFTVNNGSTLDLGTNLIEGSTGTFTLSSGGGLITANTAGITSTGATGSIQVGGTRTYNTGANYTFNGSSAQVTGNGLTGAANLTINNSSGVTLTSNTSLSGTLTLTNGILTVGSTNTITVSSGGSITATSGSLASGTGAGTFTFSGTGTISGTIGFNHVDIAGGVNFGSASTINGTLSINAGGFVNTNAPIYASGSKLKYNSGGTYGRGTEWSATSAAGYPHHVQISNGTILDLGASGMATTRQIAGNMTVDNGTTLSMALNPMTAPLTVKGNYFNYGITILSSSSGGDLVLEGNLTDNATFTANGRAIFFQGSNTQTINSSDNPLDIDVARFNKTGGEVILSQNLLIDETADPVQFAGTSILNLNGFAATFGKSNTASSITMNSTSAIKGSANSHLTIYGNGAFGTINFDQTTPGTSNQLGNLLIQRSSGSVTLGNAVSINGSLTLSSGKLIIGANTLTLAGTVASMNETNCLVGSSTSNLTVNGTGTLGTLYFDQTTPGTTNYLNTFNLNRTSSGTMNLANNLQLASLTITNGEFIQNSSQQLTVNGVLTNNGILTLNSGATFMQGSSSPPAGSGTYNVKQTITGAGTSTPTGRFWYVGSPVSGATSAVYDAAGSNILKYYDEPNNTWQEIPDNNAALAVGKGYFVQATAGTTELNFTGGTINNGSYTLDVTRNTSNNAFRGYNLLTNPYPSYLDWDNVTRSNVGTTMWYRVANSVGTMVFDTYNAPAGTGTNNNGAGAVTKHIAPMQSFWVNVPQGQTTGTVSFGNSQRSHYSTGVQGLRSTAQDFPAFLRLNLLDGSFVDQTILYMKPDANNTFDEYDSEKMFLGGVVQFYSTVNAKKLVLNGMKNQKAKTSVPLTLEMPSSKSYTFQAEEFNIEDGLILLEDKQEGVIQDLTINPTYTFFGNAGTNTTRFVVHFQLAGAPVLVGGPQELESLGSDELTTDNIQIISNNQGTVIIHLDEGFKPEGSIRIFDASGRLVEQTDFNDQETTIHLNEQAGMYFVEVSAGKLMVKKKIVIN